MPPSPMPARVSPHITWKELGCKDGTPYPAKWTDRAIVLAAEFERIRVECGGLPITIGSAYRTPSHNKAIGGAVQSQHLQGRALDLYPPAGMDGGAVLCRHPHDCRPRRLADSWAGLLSKRQFRPYDIRPIAHSKLVVWRGSRAWAETKE
jgi:hypothetical protein